MKLSIIIPVYNASLFIPECLNSIITQLYYDVEIICVNDGSTDNSLEILNEFQEKDSRIVIINQMNQGVSVARNAGLEAATGNFIGFVDADDKISPTYYAEFLKWKTADLISSSLSPEISLGKDTLYNRDAIQQLIFPYMLMNQHLNSVCVKLFRSDIIQKHHLRFPIGMRLGEDYHFVLSYLQFAQSMVITDNPGYYYRENATSATRLVKDELYFDNIFKEFEFDHRSAYGMTLPKPQAREYKSVLLVNAFISNLSLFLRKSEYLDSKTRKSIIKKYMSKLAQTGVLDKAAVSRSMNGLFNRLIFKALRYQSFSTIQLAYWYSHQRNGIE